MPTKCCWVIHGSLTSERKASTSPSSFINHPTLLLNRALKRQAPCFYMHFEVRALDRLRTRRRVGSTGRRANHMHDHSRFQRDINDVTGVSFSLSLPLTKVTDAQCRKRFRASYNMYYLALSVTGLHGMNWLVNQLLFLSYSHDNWRWRLLPSSVDKSMPYLSSRIQLKLILKAIGNRKGDCA